MPDSRPIIALVAGTRPEVIKMAPIQRALLRSETLRPLLISTAQHRQMLDQALAAFDLTSDYDLDLMRSQQTLADLTSRVIASMNTCLQEIQPQALLVQGDTTTVLGSALAAFYHQIPIGHIEAGLRTGNMLAPFPEEMNRRLTAPLARWHFCPTEVSRRNLIHENILPDLITVTGNTVIDALQHTRARFDERDINADSVTERCHIPKPFAGRFLGLGSPGPDKEAPPPFLLVTGHRRESFGEGFERICLAMLRILEMHPDTGILFPVHLNPQVQEPVQRILGAHPRIALIPPVGYEDFVWLMDRSHFILSDSGGVQEEAPSLGKPVLVTRESTERPEGVESGTCRLVGTDIARIVAESQILLSQPEEYERRSKLNNPYGDGKASERIVSILEADLGTIQGG